MSLLDVIILLGDFLTVVTRTTPCCSSRNIFKNCYNPPGNPTSEFSPKIPYHRSEMMPLLSHRLERFLTMRGSIFSWWRLVASQGTQWGQEFYEHMVPESICKFPKELPYPFLCSLSVDCQTFACTLELRGGVFKNLDVWTVPKTHVRGNCYGERVLNNNSSEEMAKSFHGRPRCSTAVNLAPAQLLFSLKGGSTVELLMCELWSQTK